MYKQGGGHWKTIGEGLSYQNLKRWYRSDLFILIIEAMEVGIVQDLARTQLLKGNSENGKIFK